MSTFEGRVDDFGKAGMDKRFEVLSRLDPGLARQYANAVDGANKDRISKNQPLVAQGTISKEEVDDILDAAFGTDNKSPITKQEEEALFMILAAPDGQIRWEPDAKKYMMIRIEEKLRDLWSVRPIVPNFAAQFLGLTGSVRFKSRGDRYKGTEIDYSPQCYQDVLRALRTGDLRAWWIPSTGLFRQTVPGKMRLIGLHHPDSNDIFVVTGLSNSIRAVAFVHEATHVIQDFRNVRAMAKFLEADAHIADAVAAIASGIPHATTNKSTESVATQGAAKLLMMPHRGKTWAKDFCKAYDDVVDAFTAEVGSAEADRVRSMKEADREIADKELTLLTGMHAAVKGKRRR